MILLTLLWSLAGAYGLGLSLVVIVQAMAKEDFDALKVRIAHAAGNVGFEYGRKAGQQAAIAQACREHATFVEAQQSNWVGPRVENEFVRVLVTDKAAYEAALYDPRTVSPAMAMGHEVLFRCVMYAHKLNGIVYKHARWELDGVEAKPVREFARRRFGELGEGGRDG